MPVGSMPYLTRRGTPLLTERSSLRTNSGCGVIASTPRLRSSNCSAALGIVWRTSLRRGGRRVGRF